MRALKCLLILLILFFESCGYKESNNAIPTETQSEDKLKTESVQVDEIVKEDLEEKVADLKEKPVKKKKKKSIPVNTRYTNSDLTVSFKINNDKDTALYTKNNVLLFIPKNSFTHNGIDTAKSVTIEIQEVLTKEDMILSNLQTLSGDILLETGGMIEVEAISSKGEKLELRDGKEIYIEVPYYEPKSGMEIFLGDRDKMGNMQWSVDTTINSNLIHIPQEYLEYRFGAYRPGRDYEDNSKRLDKMNSIIEKIKQPEYENTFISTREFSERLKHSAKASQILFGSSNPEQIAIMYINNIKKDLWVSDSIIFSKFKERLGSIKAEDPGYTSIAYYYGRYNEFYKQKLGNVELINDHGVDLSKSNALELLLSRNITEMEANRIIQKYKARQAVIDKIKKSQNANVLVYAFSTRNLGWINIDRFIDVPEEKQKRLIVKMDEQGNGSQYQTVLVFKNLNSVLSGVYKDGNFVFERLPENEPAVLVSYFYQNGLVKLAHKDLVIGENNVVLLFPKVVDEQNLRAVIKGLI